LGVCGEAVDAVEKAQQLAPDLILMDFSMPQIDGRTSGPRDCQIWHMALQCGETFFYST
jgi:AmiR/NasT family two-component response regulator